MRRPVNFNIGILTAVWGETKERTLVSNEVLKYYTGLRLRGTRKEPGISLTRIAAISPEDKYPSNTEGWETVEIQNRPLGAKWNAGLRAFESTDVQAVMIVGSDDLVNEAYFRMVVEKIERHPYAQPDDMYLYDLVSNRCVLASPFPGGAGRTIRRDVLEELKWKLWKDESEMYLDSDMGRRVSRVTKTCFTPSHKRFPMCIVDLKSTGNIWQLHRIENKMTSGDRIASVHVAEEVDGGKLLAKHFPGVELNEVFA